MTAITITAPMGTRRFDSQRDHHQPGLRSSVVWRIAWDEGTGDLDFGDTSSGLRPVDAARPTHKDNVLLALAKEVYALRRQVAERSQVDVSPGGELVRIGVYEVHGDPGRVTIAGYPRQPARVSYGGDAVDVELSGLTVEQAKAILRIVGGRS
jgi:hypothetical protein